MEWLQAIYYDEKLHFLEKQKPLEANYLQSGMGIMDALLIMYNHWRFRLLKKDLTLNDLKVR